MGVADILAKKKKDLAEKNLKDGLAFLEENKKKENIIALPSGLQYEVLVEGTGATPTKRDSVVCHYEGTLIDGTVFDSSIKRNRPATFPVSGVIEGWTRALLLMPVGSKWRLFLPPNLAYGENHVSKEIQPNSTLIFDVELLDIK